MYRFKKLTPAIGTPNSDPVAIYPYISAELLISGRISLGISKNRNRPLSHCRLLSDMSWVREAFVTSVMWIPPRLPPVKF